jgi:hypothetical protein
LISVAAAASVLPGREAACVVVSRAHALRRTNLRERAQLLAQVPTRRGALGKLRGGSDLRLSAASDGAGSRARRSFEIGAVTSISTLAVMICGPFYPRAIARLGLRLAVILA